MATATVTSKTVTTEIALAITGRTIDTGEYDVIPVTALRLTYRNAGIVAIGYDTIEDGAPGVADVHQDFLDWPEAWEGWVRELVDEHRPA